MTIRKAELSELPILLGIYAAARTYMRENGNPTQWKDNYPPDDLIREDVRLGRSLVCVDGGEIVGVFVYFDGPDPTYRIIERGHWLNDKPYGVIHHIAVASHRHGVASACFAYALSRSDNLRIDTHENNTPMRNALRKNGFTECGIIHLANGEERVAYQKER